jgi:AcrR family transcriptional regulator
MTCVPTHASPPAPPELDHGRVRQKQRTRRDLLETASRLIAEGRRPTVGEVADSANVSRRTAYRYFPTQTKMLVEAALEGVRPAMEAALAAAPSGLSPDDVGARLGSLVRSMQQFAIDNEFRLRTMIHLTVLEDTALGTPRRGTRRMEWIDLALAPLKPRLARLEYGRLRSALAVITGIEALVVLRDICGLSAKQAVEASQWMAQAMLERTLRESGDARRRPRQSPRA